MMHSGLIKLEEEEEEVVVPFQKFLRAGKSKVTISLPKAFLWPRRFFYFSLLKITPDYYNTDAVLYNFDTEEEMGLLMDYEFVFQFQFSSLTFPAEALDLSKAKVDEGMSHFCSKVNALSAPLKPDGCIHPPFFLTG